jgi:GR25 family glycosyltransferase involved in LPS biosynthesis
MEQQNKQFQSYIELLKDGLTLINHYRVNNKNVEGVNMGQFMCKYIETIKPVLTNVIALVNVDKNVIYNLIALIFKEVSICLYNLYGETNNVKLLEQMFTFSILSMRVGAFNEKELDELRKYQSYAVKKMGDDLLKYSGTSFEFSKDKEVIVTMTTCKRFDLFEQTINSFLNCCLDKELISEILVVDDNSSEEDRNKMKRLYPFITFIFKDEKDKGHAKSMNIIRNYVISRNYNYMMNIEDDWRFLFKDMLISKCKLVLEQNPMYGQCLLNKNYSEEEELHKYVGGIVKEINLQDKLLGNSVRYYEHEFYQGFELQNKMNEHVGRNTCYYWSHYSLRTGVTRVDVLKNVGEYNQVAPHFEREFSFRYTNKGYLTCYLDTLFCRHLGRKTWEINDPTAVNAYSLNETRQFENDVKRENKEVKLVKKVESKVESKVELYNELIQMIRDINNGNNPSNNFTNKLIEIIRENKKVESKVVEQKKELPKISFEYEKKQEPKQREIREVIDLSSGNVVQQLPVQQVQQLPVQQVQQLPVQQTQQVQQQVNIEDLINMENSRVKEKSYKLKVFVINLERRKDRLEKFMNKNGEQLKALNPEIFKGIDGSRLKPTNKLLKLFETSDYSYRKGIMGCLCSHVLLWLDLVKSTEYDTLLILEDDCELAPNFTSKLQSVLQQAPFINDKSAWNIVYLSHLLYPQYNDSRTKFTDDVKLELWDKERTLRENMGGTTSYLITKKGAENILEFLIDKGGFNAVDWVINKSCINNKFISSMEELKGKNLIYYCNPFITQSMNDNANCSNIDTDIQNDFTTLKLDLKTRLKREIIYWNVINKEQGYKCINAEKKIEGLNYNENSSIIFTETIPNRTTLLTNIIIIPFSSYLEKTELIKKIKTYPLVYYTIEDLEMKRIVDPDIDIPLLSVKGYIFILPETRLNDKIRNDITFEGYLNITFSVEYMNS